MAGKQAKILNARQIKAALSWLDNSRHPKRNKVMFLFSCKAGLRSIEISKVTWEMVTDSEGNLSRFLVLPNIATKGKKGGRRIPINKLLFNALSDLQIPDDHQQAVVMSERGKAMSAQTITNWFHRLYQDLNFNGCSSHSGRRTFGTQTARKITEAGGSLREVQEMMGHSSIATTQKYIDSNEDAKCRVVDLI